MATKTNRNWTTPQIKKLMSIMNQNGKAAGLRIAADHFGVSEGAIYTRYRRCKRGISTKYLDSAKVDKYQISPAVKKESKVKTPSISGNKIELNIKNVEIDLKSQKIIITY